MNMKRISVLLAKDHPLVREGFRSLLEAEADIEIDTLAAKIVSDPSVILFYPR
jgi:DNA-binding NarL/FixJ family response regulator